MVTSGPIFKVGAAFEGYRITKVVLADGGSPGGAIQRFKAIRASELRLDAIRTIYCMRPSKEESAPDALADFAKGVERLKALKVPELPEVEAGGYADGVLWVAVQDVRGETLKDLIIKRDIADPWPLEACLRLVRDMARVFKAASDQGVFHFNFTPHDVVCSPDLKLRTITAMGVLQLFGKKAQPPAHKSDMLYMAPEQILKDIVVGTKTDVYFVGLVLYEMCTLDMPFADAQGMAPTGEWLLQAIACTTLEPLASKRGFPEFIDRFLRRLVANAPERRLGWQAVIDESEATAVLVEKRMLPTALPALGAIEMDQQAGGAEGSSPAPGSGRVEEPSRSLVEPESPKKEEPSPLPRRPRKRAAPVGVGAALFAVVLCLFAFAIGPHRSANVAHTAISRVLDPRVIALDLLGGERPVDSPSEATASSPPDEAAEQRSPISRKRRAALAGVAMDREPSVQAASVVDHGSPAAETGGAELAGPYVPRTKFVRSHYCFSNCGDP